MKKLLQVLFILFFLTFQKLPAQIKLTHNMGEDPIETGMISCDRDEGWSRVFRLSDFGVAPNEQFVIKAGEIALSKSGGGAHLQFNIYSIDDTFPEFFYSLYPRKLLGSRGIGQSPVIENGPEVIHVDFVEPIIVPAGTDRILVSVKKTVDIYNPESPEVFIAGTEEDTGVSWYEGCDDNYSLTPTTEMTNPVPDANFYINVTGKVIDSKISGSTTRLTHNLCDDVIKTDIHSCTASYIYWARAFTLEEFGISGDEEFTINSGQVGIDNTGWLPEISFNIYKIDENFPASFTEDDLIGSSQYQQLSPNIGNNPHVIEVDFENPVIVPAGVKRILVEVHKGIVYGDGVAFIAGSSQDDDESWQRGCIPGGPYDEYVSTAEFGHPDANFYINVTGTVKSNTHHFQMNFSNTCSEFLTEFSIENASDIASIQWNFGDPASGQDNTSSDISPFHDFSADGVYTVIATVKGKNGKVEVLPEKIESKEPPKAYGINNLEACESTAGTGISNSFVTANIRSQVLGNQTNKIVTFIDGSGNEYDQLPNPFTNTIRDKETIKVRVARSDEPCCYDQTTFDLIIDPLPDLSVIEDIYQCSSENNGFATFDLTPIQSAITNNNITTKFFYQEGGQIPDSQLNDVVNKVKNRETIIVKASNKVTGCYNKTEFIIGVTAPPNEIMFPDLTSCDDNDDGFSEYFDTSVIMDKIASNNENVKVSFFNSEGKEMNELPNPYTNLIKNEDYFTVRLTDETSGCYSENKVLLKTSSKPNFDQPVDIYGCDEGNGYAYFDTRFVTEEMIGQQTNLKVTYFDTNGNELNGFTSKSFENQEPYSQEIIAKIESLTNESCYDEVHFSLKTQSPPEIDLEDTYQICYTNDALTLNSNDKYESTWFGPNGTVLSNTNSVTIEEEGIYGLSVLREEHGIVCESYKEFELLHSEAPAIDKISYLDFSEKSQVEIFASGDGVFEYSLDGISFQDSNLFKDVEGGEYNVTVRDKYGCGEVHQKIHLINYNRYFTPNNDGYHDTWTIKGISDQPSSFIQIYDRYGKLLKQLDPAGKGWDGMYNGQQMPSDDYWFQVTLDDGQMHSGHFSLLRSQ